MATPNSTSSAPKSMSSRLLTMKFMQRAAASSPTSASNVSSPTTPDEPSAKRRKVTDGSPMRKGFDVDALADSRAIQKALEEEEMKRQLALEKQGLEAGDTRWVLSFEGNGEDKREAKGLRVVQAGWANLDMETGLGQKWKVERDEGEEGDGDKPAVVGRRSFGKFNRVLEKQQDPSQEYSESDSEEDKDESESDDDDDHDPTKSLFKESREAAAKQLKAERKARRRAERAESVDLAKKRKKKEVKLNGAGLTSLTGRQDRQDSAKVCFKCGGPHLKAQCSQMTNEHKRPYQGKDDGPARKTIRSR